ncbi:hypothetical protein XELAEV_18036251mg [Xenopus laevis]|uniref:UPAR/Ly6 domain-containing protein n=1 Tax=Xenopus laevis TaxID=8355 RepID=A0A974CJ93_XENLA|nr:hypothetical protein XELAEV_18036251mg [Xenopus laevis]
MSSVINVNSLLCPVGYSYTDHVSHFSVHCEGVENVCLTEKIWTEFDKENDFEVIKRCAKSAECNRVGTYSSNIKKFTVNTTCCNSSMCFSPVPTFPTQVSTENGLTCPTCYAENSRQCILDEPMNCVGNENRCISFIKEEVFENTSTIQSFSGCTTDNICRLGSWAKKFLYKENQIFKTVRMEMICSHSIRLTNPVVSYLGFMLVGLRIIIFVI